MQRISPAAIALLFSLILLSACSSEERQTITDKEAQKQVERIKAPIDKAKDAAKILERHNQPQQTLPD